MEPATTRGRSMTRLRGAQFFTGFAVAELLRRLGTGHRNLGVTTGRRRAAGRTRTATEATGHAAATLGTILPMCRTLHWGGPVYTCYVSQLLRKRDSGEKAHRRSRGSDP